MDKTLSDYDQSLEELERQREHLELVMKKMGQEWEESGAGIGWMGSLEQIQAAATTTTTTTDSSSASSSTPPNVLPLQPLNDDLVISGHGATLDQSQQQQQICDPYPTPLSPESQLGSDGGMVTATTTTTTTTTTTDKMHIPQPQPLHLLMQQAAPTNGPSPDYLQSLLNVNEALLAQSLTTVNNSNSSDNDTSNCSSELCNSNDLQLVGMPPVSLNTNNNSNTSNDDVTASILSPPVTPEEYSAVRASCLSRSNSLGKSAVRPSATTTATTATTTTTITPNTTSTASSAPFSSAEQ